MNSMTDVGGMDGLGPIPIEKNEPLFHSRWESRVRCISMLANRRKKYYWVDDSRHAQERMDPVFYLAARYYQRWLLGAETLLQERGVVTGKELADRMEQILPGHSFRPELEAYRRVRPYVSSTTRREVIETTSGTQNKGETVAPRFAPGAVVTAKEMAPLGHTRVPRYIRGKTGVIEAIHGLFVLPDARVNAGVDIYQTVYRVRFEARDLWGKDASPRDKVLIELWEDYLEPGGK
jgi:nitrile hydratase beta subunit